MNPTKWIPAKAKAQRTCGACRGKIAVGECYKFFKERALSSHEAAHGGLYPVRIRCMKCTEAAIKLVGCNGQFGVVA